MHIIRRKQDTRSSISPWFSAMRPKPHDANFQNHEMRTWLTMLTDVLTKDIMWLTVIATANLLSLYNSIDTCRKAQRFRQVNHPQKKSYSTKHLPHNQNTLFKRSLLHTWKTRLEHVTGNKECFMHIYWSNRQYYMGLTFYRANDLQQKNSTNAKQRN